MTQNEIRDFKKFMNDQNAFMVFEKTYNENRMTFNPKKLEDYLEMTRADIVIPQAFIYPKGIYGKEFWLTLNKEWISLLNQKRAEHSEAVQLSGLDLEVIDVPSRTLCTGLPKDTCSLCLRGTKRLTLNVEHSKMVAKKLSTHMLVTRSRKTKDVVLMFNRQRGIEVKFKSGSNGLLFNNVELCNKLIELLELDPEKEYFQLGIELLDETKDYLLFLLKKTK
jgi:hypothetical protein